MRQCEKWGLSLQCGDGQHSGKRGKDTENVVRVGLDQGRYVKSGHRAQFSPIKAAQWRLEDKKARLTRIRDFPRWSWLTLTRIKWFNLTVFLDFPNDIGLNGSNYVSQTIHKSCFRATVHHVMMQLRGFGYDENCLESSALFVGCLVTTGNCHGCLQQTVRVFNLTNCLFYLAS